MVQANKTFRAFKPLTIALAALIGVTVGACRQDEPEEYDTGATLEVKASCAEYCEQAVICDDERSKDECTMKCIDRMTDCQVDEQAAALDRLDACSNESCDDFFGCTVNVGAQCIFGIDL